MKPEVDQEMDSLLRAHARREASVRAMTITAQTEAHTTTGVHLDADELSAYAENALPAMVRTRYSQHLADCDSCREQVVVLARAAGVADQLEQRAARANEITPSVSWRERLAALFTSGTWRYAMPVIALLFVSSIVLWVMTGPRNKLNESPNQIASASHPNEPPQLNHAEVVSQPNEIAPDNATSAPASNANANANVNNDSKSSVAPAPTPPGELARNEQSAQAGAPTGIATLPQAGQPTDKPAATQNAEPVQTQNTSQYTNSNVGAGLSNNQAVQQSTPGEFAPAPPTASGGLAKSETNQPQTKTAQESVTVVAEQPRSKRGAELDDRERSAKRGRDEPSNEDEVRPHGGPSRSLAAPKARRTEESKDKQQAEKETNGARRQPDATASDRAATTEAGETRNVGGRKFRRQNGAWVDTAYKSGQATVNVRRDSEQWRALVADEPALRRIADALGGEAIIVWKGRAYR